MDFIRIYADSDWITAHAELVTKITASIDQQPWWAMLLCKIG